MIIDKRLRMRIRSERSNFIVRLAARNEEPLRLCPVRNGPQASEAQARESFPRNSEAYPSQRTSRRVVCIEKKLQNFSGQI